MKIARLSNAFSVTGQISVDDIQHIADMGFKTIFCHRPDGEGAADTQPPQPAIKTIKQLAEAYNIQVVYLPVVPSQIDQTVIEAFSAYYEKAAKPILGYCRSGKRAMTLWIMSQAKQQTAEALKALAVQAQYNHQIWHDVMNMANHQVYQIQQLNSMQEINRQAS